MIISASAQRVLKVIHLMTISFWIGSGVATLSILLSSNYAETGSELYGALRSMNLVTLIVAVYLGGYGSFFTGLAYSICTNRGFIRHKWVVLKWGMTIFIILTGALYMGPTKIVMMELVHDHGLGVLDMPEYQRAQTLLTCLSVVNIAMFLICTVLSVYKPWEREELEKRYRYVRPMGSGKPYDQPDNPL